jgi:hypothetical protein
MGNEKLASYFLISPQDQVSGGRPQRGDLVGKDFSSERERTGSFTVLPWTRQLQGL